MRRKIAAFGLVSTLLLAADLRAQAVPDPPYKNLTILPKTITKADLAATMEGFTQQLGVKCTFCHVPNAFEKDDRPHKATARRMIKMVSDLKAKKADYFGPRTKEAVVTCGLCHRGKAEPEPFVP